MIIKYENVVTNLYKGDKICFCMFKGENLIYGARSPYSSETTRILMTNFPQKFVEICRYGDMHPQIVPFIEDSPLIAPYVCGIYEPSEDYPVLALKGFNSQYVSKTTNSIQCIAHCLDYAGGVYMTYFNSGGWAQSNSMYCEAYNGNMMYVQGNLIRGNISWGTNRIGKSYTFNVTQSRMSLYSNGVQIGYVNGVSWYGYQIKTVKSAYNTWKVLRIYDNNIEIHRYFALDDNYVWDYIEEDIINNN